MKVAPTAFPIAQIFTDATYIKELEAVLQNLQVRFLIAPKRGG
jgi:hypothetical protein